MAIEIADPPTDSPSISSSSSNTGTSNYQRELFLKFTPAESNQVADIDQQREQAPAQEPGSRVCINLEVQELQNFPIPSVYLNL